MTLEEIKEAVNNGKTVHWATTHYTVHKYSEDCWDIVHSGGHAIGLTWLNGITLNGKEEDFFIEE